MFSTIDWKTERHITWLAGSAASAAAGVMTSTPSTNSTSCGEGSAPRRRTSLPAARSSYQQCRGRYACGLLHGVPLACACRNHSLSSLVRPLPCQAHQRDRLERLCRYTTRPALCLERLSTIENRVDAQGIALPLEWDLGFGQVTSITGRRKLEERNQSWGWTRDTVGSAS